MQARLSVIVLVVALCAIFSASCSAELVQKEGSLRRGLEEVQVRDDFDASAQPPYEAAPIHGEVDEEAEPEGDDEDAPVEPMDDKEPTLIIDESEPYNLDDIDVPETEDPSLIEQGTEVKTGFDSEDAEALDDLAKANAQFPDGDLNEDFEQTIELDGSESDEQAIETDAAAQYHEAQDHYLEEDEVIEDPTKVDLHSLFSDVVEDEGAAEDEEPEHEDHEDDIAQADSTPELLSAQENEIDPEEDTVDHEGELNVDEEELDDEENLGEVGNEEIEFDVDNEDDVPEDDVEDEKDDTPHSELEEVVPDDEKLEPSAE